MQVQTKKLVVFGLGHRGCIYASFAKMHPDKFTLAAIIENDPKKIAVAEREFPNVPIFTDYHLFAEEKIEADLVAVATQDEMHREHSIAMMEAGYDLLLEKPISNNFADCVAIYNTSKKWGRKVFVCHVLRYTPFYSTVKNIIESGALGDVITIHASENVGYYHQAHSFVRGPWRNKAQSSPMILAKCCHDMDIIRYLMGERCISVNSYGELSYFKRKNTPADSAEYCSDCSHKECLYNAQALYLTEGRQNFWNYLTVKEPTQANMLEGLQHSQYDRCVYKCDNDVVDHQVTIMRFENGKTACHTMTAFSKDIYRDLKIHGTKAELVGSIDSNWLEIRHFGGSTETVNIDITAADVGDHMGGDYFMMDSLFNVLNGRAGKGITYLDVSIESHLMSFAAEESRLNEGKTCFIEI